jgi:hypothetical protein
MRAITPVPQEVTTVIPMTRTPVPQEVTTVIPMTREISSMPSVMDALQMKPIDSQPLARI